MAELPVLVPGKQMPTGVQKFPPVKFLLDLDGPDKRKGPLFPAFLGQWGAAVMSWLKTPMLKGQDRERKKMGISTAQMMVDLEERLAHFDEHHAERGAYIPCMLDGCFKVAADALAPSFSFCCEGHRDEWLAARKWEVADLEEESWERVPLGKVSCDYAREWGTLTTPAGAEVPFDPDWYALRPPILQAQAAQVATYEAAFAQVATKMLADTDGKGVVLPKVSHPKPARQPVVEINESYYHAWKCLGPLFCTACVLASKARGYGVSWSLKEPLRLRNKARDRYEGDVAKVCDVCRCDVIFDTVQDMRKALLFLLRHPQAAKLCSVVRMKNCLFDPNHLGGYRYVLVHVAFDGYVCELMLHLGPAQAALAKHGTIAYHWFHCLHAAFEGEGYWGARSISGLREGLGRYYYATLRTYAGEWHADIRHGVGVLALASGKRYEGDWTDDKQGPMAHVVYPNGDEYFGEVVHGHAHGDGLLLMHETGQAYVGSFRRDKKEGYSLLTSKEMSRRKLGKLLLKPESKRPEKLEELHEDKLVSHCLFESDKMITDHGVPPTYHREAWRAFERAKVIATDARNKAALAPRRDRAQPPATSSGHLSPRGCGS